MSARSPQLPPVGVRGSSQVQDGGDSGDADRDISLPGAPSAPERIADDDPERTPMGLFERAPDPVGRAVRVHRQGRSDVPSGVHSVCRPGPRRFGLTKPTIEDLLGDHSQEVVDLALQLRELILSVMPDATERVYHGWHGIGFYHPAAGYVCAIFPAADHVRVGFEHGHLLSDPEGVFDSGGSQVHYVTVDALTPEFSMHLGELVDQAVHLQTG